MRLLFALLLTGLITNMQAQKTLFDSLRVDKNTRIIGHYPHFDHSQKYRSLNFILQSEKDLLAFQQQLQLGKETRNFIEHTGLKIAAIQNFRVVGVWTLNPSNSTVMTHDGKTYELDLAQITALSQSHPLDYVHTVKEFESESDFLAYFTAQQNNPKFLFTYPPHFDFEGRFEMTIPKSNEYPNPKAIIADLDKQLRQIATKEQYSLAYILDKRNLKEQNQFIITLQTSKEIYKQFKPKRFKKSKFKHIKKEGYFFYAK